MDNNSCDIILRCGHVCLGFKQETICPPCLRQPCISQVVGHTQDCKDNCTICYAEPLSAFPIIMLNCGHAFHLHCVKQILENKWVGPRLEFGFLLCPLCKVQIQHPELEAILAPLIALHDDVRRKARMRLRYEGHEKSDPIVNKASHFNGNPDMYAMEIYSYYQCFNCKKPYFGGGAQCADGIVDKTHIEDELVCPSCSGPKHVQTCSTHGTEFIEYKCRYCCNIAAFFCFGNTHFCNSCHNQAGTVPHIKPLPSCPAGPGGKQLDGNCPLGIVHPPTGQEFCLGCGLCAHMQTF